MKIYRSNVSTFREVLSKISMVNGRGAPRQFRVQQSVSVVKFGIQTFKHKKKLLVQQTVLQLHEYFLPTFFGKVHFLSHRIFDGVLLECAFQLIFRISLNRF